MWLKQRSWLFYATFTQAEEILIKFPYQIGLPDILSIDDWYTRDSISAFPGLMVWIAA